MKPVSCNMSWVRCSNRFSLLFSWIYFFAHDPSSMKTGRENEEKLILVEHLNSTGKSVLNNTAFWVWGIQFWTERFSSIPSYLITRTLLLSLSFSLKAILFNSIRCSFSFNCTFSHFLTRNVYFVFYNELNSLLVLYKTTKFKNFPQELEYASSGVLFYFFFTSKVIV